MTSLLGAVAVALVTTLTHAADAPPAVLVQGPALTVTTLDIQADGERIPPAQRAEVLAQPGQVAQIASDLYVRRALAREAEAAALEKSPRVQAALLLARERVLSDAMLERIGAGAATDAKALEDLARTEYNAHPERYRVAESVHVRHILIRGTTEESQAKAEKLLQQLQGGADFDQLARQESQDPGSAAKGGDLGFFERGKMVPEFEQAAFALTEPGQLSALVKTQFGYHILRLEGRKPARQQAFDDVKDGIERNLRARLMQDARVGAADKLRQEAVPQTQAIEAFSASQAAPAPKQ